MNSSTRFARATEKVNDFYASNLAVWFFMTATTIFALLQVILYSLNLMQVNGSTIEAAANSHHTISNWILLAASIFACYAGFMGGILLFRGSLNFIYWHNASTILAIVTQSLAGMWFGAFVSAYFILTNSIRFYLWKRDLVNKWNFSNEIILISSLIYLFVLLVLLNSISFFFGDQLYKNSIYIENPDGTTIGWMLPYNYQFDATGASLNMAAAVLLIFKNRWAFVLFALGKVFTIWNYADAGLIVPIVQMMLFWVMDFTGFIGWSIQDEDGTETKIVTAEEKLA